MDFCLTHVTFKCVLTLLLPVAIHRFLTCINHCLDAGIKSFSSVHDAYGTHMANMDTLSRINAFETKLA